jgi:Tol biopolymer transport system component
MRGTNRVFGLGIALIIFSVAAASIATAFPGQTTRVSVDSTGVPANAGSTNGVLSADGRYVVFQSSATNLVTGASGTQVYRHDRTSGATVLVSVATTGNAGNNVSRDPSVSANGRYVAFASFATDLVDGDTNSMSDVFVRDMQAGTTTLVSSAGAPTDGSSGLSGLSGAREISDDGRYVAFTSFATNLAPGTNNGKQQIYVKDTTTGAVVRASVNALTGESGDRTSQTPSISGNGQVVAFRSESTNFSPLSISGITPEVFARDLVAGTTTLESAGAAATGRSATTPVLSFDGRYLAFESTGVLDPRDLDNGTLDIYLRDRVAGTTVLASLSNNALPGATSASPSISGDGRWVAFNSLDDKLVVGDLNGLFDVFIYDRTTETIKLVSLNDADEQANAASFGPSVSFDGHLVLFGSTASNLVTSPPSTGNQLYVRNLVSNQAPVLQPFGKDVLLFESQPLHLTWQFSDNDGSTSWTATVDYGDGTGVQTLALNADKTFVLDHLYVPGAYDLTVAVTDDAGATGSLMIHVVVGNVAPSVNLSSTLDLAFTKTLDASGTFTDPGSNETYSATVNYGDGTGTQTLALGPFDASPLAGGSFTLHHTYAAAGPYTVTVIVSDSNGGSTPATMLVNLRGFSYQWLDPLGDMFVVGRNLPVKFTVDGPDGSFVLDQTVRVDVVDASDNVMAGPYFFGDQPSRSVVVSNDSYHVNVDTRNLAAGVYWLRVQFSSPTLTGEFRLATTGTAAAFATTASTRTRTAR